MFEETFEKLKSAIDRANIEDFYTYAYAQEIKANVKYKDKDGKTLLDLAVEKGLLDITKYLLSDCGYNEEPALINQALCYAIKKGHIDIIEHFFIVLRNKINPNLAYLNGASALHLAIECGDLNIVKFLIEHGADLEFLYKLDDKTRTPLQIAAEKNNTAMVKLLLDKGAALEGKNERGNTPLGIAAFHGSKDVLCFLIEAGANINAENSTKWTPMHYAAMNDHVEVVRMLALYGANVNALSDQGASPLCFAASRGHFKIAELLLQGEADPNCTPDAVWSVLMEALGGQYIELIKLLLSHGAKYNNAQTMRVAVQSGNKEIIALLLRLGADHNIEDSLGFTPFIAAANFGHLEVMKMFWERGLNINHLAKNGGSALYMAASKEHLPIIEWLINLGAKLNLKSDNNVTPFHAAVIMEKVKSVAMLAQAKADMEVGSPIKTAIEKGNLAIVKIMVDNGYNLYKMVVGKTPYNHALENKQKEIASYIAEKLGTDYFLHKQPQHLLTADDYKGQIEFITPMQQLLKYRESAGVCWGVAHTAIIFFLSLQHRLYIKLHADLMHRHLRGHFSKFFSDDPQFIHELKDAYKNSDDEILSNMPAFLDMIEFFQHMQDKSFPLYEFHIRRGTYPAMRFMLSETLEKQGGVHCADTFSGMYSRNELTSLLKSFFEVIRSTNLSTVLVLNNFGHGIAVISLYDKNEDKRFLFFIDANGMPNEIEEDDAAALSNKIFTGFFIPKNHQICGFNTKCYVTGEDLLAFEALLNHWKEGEVWKKIQRPTIEKAKVRDAYQKASWTLYAAAIGDARLVSELIQLDPTSVTHELESKTFISYTPLKAAVYDGDVSTIKVLIEHGADVNQKNGDYTLFDSAIQSKDLNIIQLFLDHGANLDEIVGADKITHLMYAFCFTNKTVVKFLLDKDANIYKKDKSNKTVIFYAIEKGWVDLVQYFLECGLDINSCDNSLLIDELHVKDDSEIFNLLIDYNAVNVHYVRADNSVTAMFIAAQENRLVSMLRLLQLNVSIEVPFVSTEEKLMAFAKNRDNKKMSAMIAEKKAKGQSEKISLTPLDIATVMGHSLIIKVLSYQTILNQDSEAAKNLPRYCAIFAFMEAIKGQKDLEMIKTEIILFEKLDQLILQALASEHVANALKQDLLAIYSLYAEHKLSVRECLSQLNYVLMTCGSYSPVERSINEKAKFSTSLFTTFKNDETFCQTETTKHLEVNDNKASL